MGQQQLLLIVMGVIIVGIAIVVGLSMILGGARQQNEAAIVNDCLSIVGNAQDWVRKPATIGGPRVRGDFSSLDFSKLGKTVTPGTVIWTNPNGDRYWIIGGGNNFFSLIAFGREGVWVIYFNITSSDVPQPEIFRSWGSTSSGI